MPQELDLTPDPRVLQMLGEINLNQWRCLAELIDNAIDGFLQAAREGTPIQDPEVIVTIPMADNENARVTVRDNGPGMSFETLENAVKAGWSGNNPLSNLGLFGMGFNIATARLGLVTEVWTSRAGDPEQVGVRIDLDELRSTRNFKVPRQTRAKPDHTTHGTEIVVTRLKPDQRAYLARSGNQRTIRTHLSRTYSSLLTRSEAGRIRLSIGATRLRPRRPCVWAEERSVELPDGTTVHAVEKIDVALAPRRYCTHCMRTLASEEESCPTGSANCNVIETQRRIRGWVGLQRYLDKTDFGLDFVRNGRKIEIANKDLFVWSDGESSEVEYPIDDPRNRGRFVGEIHLDHCRVSYTKDRFERDDPSWGEMLRVVRGEGPLRPNAAKQQGYGANQSPLYKLYQAFRRSSPQGKNGLWSRMLVVRDNDRAQQMAQAFADGEAEYLPDDRWWQLVEEQDAAVLGEVGGDKGDTPLPEGFLDEGGASGDGGAGPGGGAQTTEGTPTGPAPAPTPPAPPPAPVRRPLHELSRKYIHPTFRVEYDVEAFAVEAGDPDLPVGLPWTLKLADVATRTYAFLVDVDHGIFRSTTMMPLDGLLTELTHRSVEFLRGQSQEATLAGVIADYRQEYCTETRLDPQEIIAFANTVLADIARAVGNLPSGLDGKTLYAELTPSEQEAVARRMAARGVTNHKAMIADGRFWDYTDGSSLRSLFRRHPEMFLDGHYWDDGYSSIDFGAECVTDEARARVVARYDAYLGDAVWLSNQTPADLERGSRDAIVRATCSLRLLRPDTAE
jgi:hypothetical protein